MGWRQDAGELVGTAGLLTAVVGSGVMAASLSGGNDGLALLANALATGAALVVLITTLGPVSGAHFNPVVTGVAVASGELDPLTGVRRVVAQLAGGLLGVGLAHAMFDLPILQVSTHARASVGLWISEVVATAGLIGTIEGGRRHAPDRVPVLVALYVVSAYWFTASTSFANPAVTFARAWTDTFAGIRPADAPAFVVAQLVGAAVGAAGSRALLGPPRP